MMSRKHTPVASCREYMSDGLIVGAVVTYWYGECARYIVEVRDWSRKGKKYVPICVGPRDSLFAAEVVIETAASSARERE
jgi:hypothetical protein